MIQHMALLIEEAPSGLKHMQSNLITVSVIPFGNGGTGVSLDFRGRWGAEGWAGRTYTIGDIPSHTRGQVTRLGAAWTLETASHPSDHVHFFYDGRELGNLQWF